MKSARNPAARGTPDANQAAIVRELVLVGATVRDLHKVGGGCPDLLVGFGGRNYLMEVKRPDGGRVESKQAAFFRTWNGQTAIVRTPTEALTLIGVRQLGAQP